MSERLKSLEWYSDMSRVFGGVFTTRAKQLENMTDAEYTREQQRIETAADKARDQDSTPRYNRPVPLRASGWRTKR